MTQQFLEFERPIAELKAKIHELRMVTDSKELNINEEISRLQAKCQDLTESIFANLSPWEIVQLARHPGRPHTQDYIDLLFTEFEELQGDRHTACGSAIIAGLARFQGQPVMVMGHEKGRRTKEKVARNFGMARPEDYRKALRLMEMAEKFQLPLLTFIDTPGAYPGIDAEEHNQSEAIAKNLQVMSTLKTPILCTVIGEGGSGGALAIGVGDRVLMLQYSIYATISPEGCASILWKSADKAAEAAEAMGMSADRLLSLGLIDKRVVEPLGGAHRDFSAMANTLQSVLAEQLAEVQSLSIDQLLLQRYQKLMKMGA